MIINTLTKLQNKSFNTGITKMASMMLINTSRRIKRFSCLNSKSFKSALVANSPLSVSSKASCKIMTYSLACDSSTPLATKRSTYLIALKVITLITLTLIKTFILSQLAQQKELAR